MVQTDLFWFGKVFRIKTGSNWFDLVFSDLALFFWFGSVFFWFGSVFSVWVWFSFFGFKLIKPNQTSRFF